MFVDYEQVKEDLARKDAEIAELKVENDRLKDSIHNLYYCEASKKGAGHHQADDYANQMIDKLNK